MINAPSEPKEFKFDFIKSDDHPGCDIIWDGDFAKQWPRTPGEYHAIEYSAFEKLQVELEQTKNCLTHYKRRLERAKDDRLMWKKKYEYLAKGNETVLKAYGDLKLMAESFRAKFQQIVEADANYINSHLPGVSRLKHCVAIAKAALEEE